VILPPVKRRTRLWTLSGGLQGRDATVTTRMQSLPSLVVRMAATRNFRPAGAHGMQDEHYVYLLMDHLEGGELFSLLVEVNYLPPV
jgi:hypothetical protein